MENSPSGLWRTLGKRVGVTASRVRISYSPPGLEPRKPLESFGFWGSFFSTPFFRFLPDSLRMLSFVGLGFLNRPVSQVSRVRAASRKVPDCHAAAYWCQSVVSIMGLFALICRYLIAIRWGSCVHRRLRALFALRYVTLEIVTLRERSTTMVDKTAAGSQQTDQTRC